MADLGTPKNADDIQRVVQEYAEAVRTEFEIATGTDPDKFEEAARDFGRQHGGEALAQIHWLMTKADSESIRLSASKYIVELARAESDREGDPIKDMLKKLTKNKNSPVPSED